MIDVTKYKLLLPVFFLINLLFNNIKFVKKMFSVQYKSFEHKGSWRENKL